MAAYTERWKWKEVGDAEKSGRTVEREAPCHKPSDCRVQGGSRGAEKANCPEPSKCNTLIRARLFRPSHLAVSWEYQSYFYPSAATLTSNDDSAFKYKTALPPPDKFHKFRECSTNWETSHSMVIMYFKSGATFFFKEIFNKDPACC